MISPFMTYAQISMDTPTVNTNYPGLQIDRLAPVLDLLGFVYGDTPDDTLPDNNMGKICDCFDSAGKVTVFLPSYVPSHDNYSNRQYFAAIAILQSIPPAHWLLNAIGDSVTFYDDACYGHYAPFNK